MYPQTKRIYADDTSITFASADVAHINDCSSQYNYDLSNVVHVVISYQEYAELNKNCVYAYCIKAKIIEIARKSSWIKP